MACSTLKYRVILLFFAASMLYSCRVKKHIPDGEYLFRGGEVEVKSTEKVEKKKDLEEELQSLLYPEPNKRFLGLYPGLHYHYRAQKENPGFVVRYLNRKIGEKPVYFSDVDIEKTKELIENRLQNNGFFQSDIFSTIHKDTNSRKAFSNYKVVIEKPYVLNKYRVEIDSIEKLDSFPIYEELENAVSQSSLKQGSRYDLSAFKMEREKIDEFLKVRGYYNFNSSFLIFQVDTNLNNNKTYNLFLKLKEGVPAKSKVPYKLNSVEVLSNTVKDSGIKVSTLDIDSVTFKGDNSFFLPKRLRPFIRIKAGELFDPVGSKYTSRQISSIGTYQFVNIDYKEIEPTGQDSNKIRYLNTTISLSPLTKRSLQAELQGVTKSNNFAGPSLGITYLNRNVFKGGENFSAKANIGYEKQFGNKTSGSNNLQLGLSTSLVFPRLIFPGSLDLFFKYSIPKTKINVGYDYYRRSALYSLNSYSTTFGYSWNPNRHLTHQLNPININYLQLGNKSSRFNSILDSNVFLKRSFEQQFIAGLTYAVYFNNLNDSRYRGRFNIKFNFDVAGNTLNLFGERKAGDEAKSVLGLPYAQYIKGDIDLSCHFALNSKGHSIVGRAFGGIGIPYGNSKTLPYVKQYFSGGAYSVRAFQIRGLGPGTYNPSDVSNLYFDRSGDIRLEGNLEYRFPIVSYFKGALFADAGNIWNLNDNLEGGKFTPDFINQFGVGIGFGLRIDVQGFVIRFDLAAPVKRPATEWEFDYKNPVFNFAIGYPF